MIRRVALLFLAVAATNAANADVPADRLKVLSRGANISTIFEDKTEFSNDTMKTIAADGFKHVRVFVLLESLNDPAYLRRLDQLIAETARLRLGIILCMNSKTYAWEGHGDVEQFWVAGWTLLAKRYRTSSPKYVFLELANEPNIDPDQWVLVQEHLRQVVRSILPRHTLLLTGSPFSTVWSLPKNFSRDDDVAYAFHLYQPMIVTHQGAEWDPSYQPFVGLVYPPNSDNVARMTNSVTAERLAEYKREGSLMMRHEIGRAAAWRAETHVSVVCTEFGIYGKARPSTRVAWLSEARRRLEAAKIGWTVWEYKGGFGVAPLLPNAPLTRALGLDR